MYSTFGTILPFSPTVLVFPWFSVTDLKNDLSLVVCVNIQTQCIKMADPIKTPITMIQNAIDVSLSVSSLSAKSFSGNPEQQSVPQHNLRLLLFTEDLNAS